MSSTKKSGKTTRSALKDVVAREYTIHLHKRVRLTNPPPKNFCAIAIKRWTTNLGHGNADGVVWNRCTVLPSRRGLPAPSRRSRISPTSPWYAHDASLPSSTEKLCAARSTGLFEQSIGKRGAGWV